MTKKERIEAKRNEQERANRLKCLYESAIDAYLLLASILDKNGYTPSGEFCADRVKNLYDSIVFNAACDLPGMEVPVATSNNDAAGTLAAAKRYAKRADDLEAEKKDIGESIYNIEATIEYLDATVQILVERVADLEYQLRQRK